MKIIYFIQRSLSRLRNQKMKVNRSVRETHCISPKNIFEMKLSKRFEGKVVLITGGGSGIGRAIAIRLSLEGASIAIAGRTKESIQNVRKEIESQGNKVIDIQCDVSNESDCKRMVEQTINEFSRIDVLITSAGIHGGGNTVVDTPVDVWDKVIDIDLKGVYLSSKFVIPEMKKVGCGAIVHISSIGGLTGQPYAMAFQSAKGGVINLTRHMAVAHANENIRVNCICPGVVRTPLTERWLSNPRVYKRVCEGYPMKRICEPDEIASTVAFLASDEASFITGVILPIDGGYLASGHPKF